MTLAPPGSELGPGGLIALVSESNVTALNELGPGSAYVPTAGAGPSLDVLDPQLQSFMATND